VTFLSHTPKPGDSRTDRHIAKNSQNSQQQSIASTAKILPRMQQLN
jgi:hypothetical protein